MAFIQSKFNLNLIKRGKYANTAYCCNLCDFIGAFPYIHKKSKCKGKLVDINGS